MEKTDTPQGFRKSNRDGWTSLAITLILCFFAFISKDRESLAKVLYILALLSGLITISGLILISNNPPEIGLLTKNGERLWKKDAEGNFIAVYMAEGYNWLFMRGIFQGYILMPMEKREYDFSEIELITPDNGELTVTVSIAYTPSRKNLVNYLNQGGNADFVIADQLQDILDEQLRIYATSETEGPQTWKAFMGSKKEVAEMIIQKIAGDVDISEKEFNKTRVGHGKLEIEGFGINLTRLNIKSILPHGEVYEAARKLNVEKAEGESETYEMKTDVDKAIILQEKLKTANVVMDLDACIDKVMEWKIRREANNSLSLSALAQTIVDVTKKK